jgi:hypothetical protein
MSGCPKIEAVGRWSSGGGWIETKTGAPFTSLGGLLLELGLGNHLSLQLLSLHGLPDHLKLDHLHLHLRARQHVRWREWRIEGVHPKGIGLLSRKAVVGTIDGSSDGNIPVVVDGPLGHVANLIALLVFRVDVDGRERSNVESTAWSSSMGGVQGG